jgi:hypothetical protein
LKREYKDEIPTHWNLSEIHKQFLKTELKNYYEDIFKFSDEDQESIFNKYLLKSLEAMKDMILFMDHIPIFDPIIKDGVEYWHLFNYEVIQNLQEYCLLSVIYEYIHIGINMKSELLSFSEEDDEDEEDDDAANNRTNILTSQHEKLKTEIRRYLSVILTRERETKLAINFDYKDIMERTMGLKLKDKQEITTYLGRMSRDERRVEQTLRSHKLGRWNMGNQKSLYQYDKESYDKETKQWHQHQEDDSGIRMGTFETGGNERDADELELEEQQQQEEEYDDADEDDTDGNLFEDDYEDGDYL